jgi:MYXO-CTERM domain-containing protein
MLGRHRWILALALAGCAVDDPSLGESVHALDAYCEATVIGTGVLDVENDYLPQVIACENGAASDEALQAQAVAARTFLYYKLASAGQIGDGQGDQVYTCSNPAGDRHRAAAAATSGQVLRYGGITIAAFYVAGALQDGPDCRGGSNDPTGTEHYVTYNEGRSGGDIEQTTLGWVDPANTANRGCQSQNGAHCLSNEGWDHEAILRFYYGEDINLVTAEGPCVEGGEDPPPDDDPPPGEEEGEGGGLVGGCSTSGSSGSGWFALCLLALAFRRRR